MYLKIVFNTRKLVLGYDIHTLVFTACGGCISHDTIIFWVWRKGTINPFLNTCHIREENKTLKRYSHLIWPSNCQIFLVLKTVLSTGSAFFSQVWGLHVCSSEVQTLDDSLACLLRQIIIKQVRIFPLRK